MRARPVRPEPSDYLVVDGWQLNGLCRRLDVDTLFYVGFMTDICVRDSQGAFVEMSSKFRYRCAVVRDATCAFEYADTHADRAMNRAAIRTLEYVWGYSVDTAELLAAF